MFELSQLERRFTGRENLNVGANIAAGLSLGLVFGAAFRNIPAGLIGGLLLANLVNGLLGRRPGNKLSDLALAISFFSLLLYALILAALAAGLFPVG